MSAGKRSCPDISICETVSCAISHFVAGGAARVMLRDLIVVSTDDTASLPALESLSAPLRGIALGLRCADALGRSAFRAEVALPPRLRFDKNLDATSARMHTSLGAIPPDVKCHQLRDDGAAWRCGRPVRGGGSKMRGTASPSATGAESCANLAPPEWSAVRALAGSYGLWARAPKREVLKAGSRLAGGEDVTSQYKLAILVPTMSTRQPASVLRQLSEAVPLSFYLSALEALRPPGHNATEPFLVVVPSPNHPIGLAIARAMPQAARLVVQPASAAEGNASDVLALHDARQIVSGDPDVKYLLSMLPRPVHSAWTQPPVFHPPRL